MEDFVANVPVFFTTSKTDPKSLLMEHLISAGDGTQPQPVSQLSTDLPNSLDPIKDVSNPVVLRKTTGDRPWACDLCSFLFKYKNNLLEHLRFFHMKGSVPCNSCSQVFPTSRHLRIHRKHHSLEAGRCPHCRANFIDLNGSIEDYKEQYKRHLPSCRRCPSSLSKRLDFSSHALNDISDDNAIWRCLFCCSSFGGFREYQLHDCTKNSLVLSDDSMDDQHVTRRSEVDVIVNTNLKEIVIPSTIKLTMGLPNITSSNIDFNCLCVICGINFVSDEDLNAHLYECHQTLESGSIEIGGGSNLLNREEQPSEQNVLFCEYCREEFVDNVTKDEHETECKINLHEQLQTTQFDLPNVANSTIDYGQSNKPERDIPEQSNSANDCSCGLDNQPYNDDRKDYSGNAKLNHVEQNYVKTAAIERNPKQDIVESYHETYVDQQEPMEVDWSKSVNVSNEADIENGMENVRFVCKYCNNIFPDRSFMREHQESCQIELKEKLNIKPNLETATSEALQVHNSPVHWICDFCKNTFPRKDEAQAHEKHCTRRPEAISNTIHSDVTIRWVCKYCKQFFNYKIEMRDHKKQCSLKQDTVSVFDSINSEVELCCKYCKITFTNQKEFQTHTQQCNLKDDVVKWICMNCKKDFPQRENMQSHKKNCLNRNLDKNVLSDKESDMSDVRNFHKKNDASGIPISETISRNMEGYFQACNSENDLSEVMSQENIAEKNAISVNVSRNWETDLQESHSKNNVVFQTPIFEDRSRNPLATGIENVTVKWICKYCKKDFHYREDMRCHKKMCSNRNRDKNVLSSTESDMSEVISQENHPEKTGATETHTPKNFLTNLEDIQEIHSNASRTSKLLASVDIASNTEKLENLNVIVKWICKYCKKEFLQRDTMRSHKKNCASMNKDKYVVSSTESDMSEGLLLENNPKSSNSPKRLACVNASRKPEYLLENNSNSTAAAKPLLPVNNPKNPESPEIENVIVKWICKYCKKNFSHRDDMHNHKRICYERNKDRSTLFSTESDMSEVTVQNHNPKTIVKWICKYCKNVFLHRENMLDHKKICTKKNKSMELNTESDTSNVQLQENNLETKDLPEKVKSENVSRKSDNFQENDSNSAALQTLASSDTSKELDTTELLSINDSIVTVFVPSVEIPPVDSTPMDVVSNEQPVLIPKVKLVLLKCNFCFKPYTSRTELKLHKLELHTFKCYKCQRFFGNSPTFRRHVRNCKTVKGKEANSKKYTCKNCYRIFRERYKYQLHKGSCTVITNKPIVNNNIVLIGQSIQLKIKCDKCEKEFIGVDSLEEHTCEKSTPVSVYLVCKCTQHAFTDITRFYIHCLKCPQSGYPMSRHVSSPIIQKVSLKCGVCKRHFKSVIFYYYHVLGEPFCRSIESTDTENIDLVDDYGENLTEGISIFTCSRCKIDFPNLISKNSHDDICRWHFKQLEKDTLETSSTHCCRVCAHTFHARQDLANHDCKAILQYMTSCQVVLEYSQLANMAIGCLDSLEFPSQLAQHTSVQKCVICHKKCRFRGVGLPPIGQLECFKCRRKNHKKPNKNNPGYYRHSSSIADIISNTDTNEQFTSSANTQVYLNPTLRLKISRAKNKDKIPNKSNPMLPNRTQQNAKPTPGIPYSKSLSYKCSHCKRGFPSVLQYQKHMQLSKTCFLAVMSNIEQKKKAVEQNGVGLKESTRTHFQKEGTSLEQLYLLHKIPTSQEDNVSSVSSDTSESGEIDVEEVPNCEERCIPARASQLVYSDKQNQRKSPHTTEVEKTPSRSYLVMENIDKILRSKPEIKRVPVCSSLLCDGWIFKSSDILNPAEVMNSKCICGGCYRSFSQVKLLREHMSQVHKRQPHVVPVLKLMEHLPKGML